MRGRLAVATVLAVAAAARVAVAQPAPHEPPVPPPPPPVPADDADALVAQGEDLAKAGEYSRAIDSFKRADAILRRTRHACLIGLVYTRRELWTQAELFFAKCHDRATADDPLPDWAGEAERQLAAKLAEVDVAAVDVRTDPPDAQVELTIASFPPDETFTARVIHLAVGSHVITTAPGAALEGSQKVEITAKDPITVTIRVAPPGEHLGGGDILPPPPPPPRRNITKYLWIGAGGAAGLGAVFHVLASRERSQLSAAARENNTDRYDKHSSRFDTFRAVTFACYGAAFTAAGIGLVLYLTRDKATESTRIGGWLDAGGGGLTLEWDR